MKTKKEFNYDKDENRGYQYDWENLKVGDVVFSDSSEGVCSGGITYGCGDRVVSITESVINTVGKYSDRAKWDKSTRFEKKKEPVYYLGAFQSR